MAVRHALLAVLGVTMATMRYVEVTGNDAGGCTNSSQPCKTLTFAIAAMQGGDELVIGDGTYAEPVRYMLNGTAQAWTIIRARNDWKVLIDGSGFSDSYIDGISVSSKSYVRVRGLRVKMNQLNLKNNGIGVYYSDHVKIERCSVSHAPADGNSASIGVGPDSSYVTVEECYAFGGARYQFLVYQSAHCIVRRCVGRLDYWLGTTTHLQCAGFVNYDSSNTLWQNNIILDSDTVNCMGGNPMFGGFFNENKDEPSNPLTAQEFQGNIVLNVQAYYAGDLDELITGDRIITDMIIWGSKAGYSGSVGPGVDQYPARLTANRLTIGGLTGTYDGNNGQAAAGTGVSVYKNAMWGNMTNTVSNSLFVNCSSYGVVDEVVSNYNAYFGNKANFGGSHLTPNAGANDRCSQNNNALDVYASGLRYLPRIEPGSVLKTAGSGGGQMGAEVMFKYGTTGTLHGETGYNTLTSEPLWPFPNEDQIKTDMASYTGPGAAGARGFATGNSRDGTPQTLTKYVWEYLGNTIPSEVYAGTPPSPPSPVVSKSAASTAQVCMIPFAVLLWFS